MKEKILAMWAHPRSTSTAFEWMMRQRGDFWVFHEPFGLSYYNSEDRLSKRSLDILPQPEHNCKNVRKNLKQAIQQQNVFIKDMATHIIHLADEEFLADFTHTFLIRHPRKTLPAIFHHWSDFTLEETGYKDLWDLFQKVKAQSIKPPVVIDSDDLLQSPPEVVKAYCDAVDIPFVSQALNWQPGDREEVSWFDEGSWHEYLKTSQELKERKNKNYLDIEDNEHLTKAYEISFPYYDKLYQHRLGTSVDHFTQ